MHCVTKVKNWYKRKATNNALNQLFSSFFKQHAQEIHEGGEATRAASARCDDDATTAQTHRALLPVGLGCAHHHLRDHGRRQHQPLCRGRIVSRGC